MNNRIEYVDALRGVMIIIVVLWHVAILQEGGYLMIFSSGRFINDAVMPVFCFISGFVMYNPDKTCRQ